MRLWTLHPKYLDPQGLTALWREGLLAQKVLHGKTKGYTHHPQLDRFKATRAPGAAIGKYLQAVVREASRRQYHFAAAKIVSCRYGGKLTASRGQLLYEWKRLKAKLRARSPGVSPGQTGKNPRGASAVPHRAGTDCRLGACSTPHKRVQAKAPPCSARSARTIDGLSAYQ